MSAAVFLLESALWAVGTSFVCMEENRMSLTSRFFPKLLVLGARNGFMSPYTSLGRRRKVGQRVESEGPLAK